MPSRRARRVAPASEIVHAPIANGDLHSAGIVAEIVERAGRGLVGERAGGNEIAPDHVERVETELDGDTLHEAFQREIELRTAETADERRRRLVGQDDPVGDGKFADIIGTGACTMHAIEGAGHGRTQERAIILHLVHAQSENLAVTFHRCFDLGDPVRAGACSGKMFQPVFDPFDRAPHDARGKCHQHDEGKNRKLDARSCHRYQPGVLSLNLLPGTRSARAITGCPLNGP